MGEFTGAKPAAKESGTRGGPARASHTEPRQEPLEALQTLLCRLAEQEEGTQGLLTLAEAVARQLNGQLTEVWERVPEKPEGESLRRVARWTVDGSAPKQAPSAAYVSRLRQLPGLHADRPFPELPSELAGGPRPACLLAQPIELPGKPLGVLTLYRDEPSDTATVQWFRAFVAVAALALDHSRLSRENEKAIAQMQSVIEASKVLHSTLELDELLELVLKLATSEAAADRGTVFLADPQKRELWSLVALGLERQEIRLPFGRGIAGTVAESGQVMNIPDAYQNPLFDPSFDERFGYRSRNILCLPIRNNRGEVLGVLQLINKKTGAFGQEDIDILQTLSVHMALALENAQRHKELLARQRIEKEMALARNIQRSLLPLAPPVVPGYDIAVLHEPCFEVGGDYYDFLSLGANTLLLVVADVEGKGVASALIMSNLQATLRALVVNQHSLEVIVGSLNRMIREDTRSQKFLSIFLGLIDRRGRGIHYVNAGHVPPVIVRGENEVIPLENGGIVIGLFDSPEYERGSAKLLPGDVLLFCTDGIVEAMNAEREEYGSERLAEAARRYRQHPAQELVDLVRAEVQEFSQEGTHVDDRILMAVKVEEPPGE